MLDELSKVMLLYIVKWLLNHNFLLLTALTAKRNKNTDVVVSFEDEQLSNNVNKLQSARVGNFQK